VTKTEAINEVQRIDRLTDPAAARHAERCLWEDVLTTIRAGRCTVGEAQQLATLALLTMEMDFGRAMKGRETNGSSNE
jgi:hypothetical protein